ncbi:MAG: bifunctional DNA primase/polymerase [Planctomycetes bacterium]|nr:bifunctional DNA primase/polymerase [Planctomycetota bacterium]
MTATSAPTTLRDNVEYGYNNFGWSFTPLNGKQAQRHAWQKVPRETLEQALHWCDIGNVGLRTGANSGIVVIDVDPGGDHEPLNLPPTVAVRTGRGGLHLYYRANEPIRNSAGTRLGPHIDVRGDGGQVVFPGSTHPDTGVQYEWVEGYEPWSIEIAELPAHIIERLNAPKPTPQAAEGGPTATHPAHAGRQVQPMHHAHVGRYARAALEREVAAVQTAPEGQRNDQLNRSAFALGTLVGAGHLDGPTAETSLHIAAVAAGLQHNEIMPTIRSGIESGIAHPREIEPQAAAKTAEQVGNLTIRPRWKGKAHRAAVAVEADGEPILMDTLDVSNADRRAAFISRVTGAVPDADAEDLEQAFLRLAAERSKALEQEEQQTADKTQDPTVAELLVAIALNEAELAHDADHRGYARFRVDDHREAWPVRSKGFRRWLRRRLWEREGRSAYANAVDDALEQIEAQAQFSSEQIDPAVRVAREGEAIYLDLGDDDWRAVAIAADGWRVLDECPVWFIRPGGMEALPAPQRGGAIGDLRQFLNIDDDGFVLVVAWLLAALSPSGPYPILSVSGEQGSAKSTTQRMLRALVDPNKALLRSEPRDERDLVITAGNSWALGFDNLSNIQPWLSDAFCRLSTGGGFATRELYSDTEEVILAAKRPMLMNGIPDLAVRADLADRSISITLEAIPPERRREERVLWAEFEMARPRILGSLLGAVSAGLRYSASVQMDRLPRMADFAKWIVACEYGTGWVPGTFMQAYEANLEEAVAQTLDASAVGTSVVALMDRQFVWKGTAAELLTALANSVDDATRRRRDWPGTARKLGEDLRRIRPSLRKVGINFEYSKTRHGVVYHLWKDLAE